MEEKEKPKKYLFFVDKKKFEVEERYITGRELKKLAGVPEDYGVWLKVTGPASDDQEIQNDEQYDLSKPGTEHFFTGPKKTQGG
jgi:hypothetical protein